MKIIILSENAIQEIKIDSYPRMSVDKKIFGDLKMSTKNSIHIF
jgi:hypothetical protein